MQHLLNAYSGPNGWSEYDKPFLSLGSGGQELVDTTSVETQDLDQTLASLETHTTCRQEAHETKTYVSKWENWDGIQGLKTKPTFIQACVLETTVTSELKI